MSATQNQVWIGGLADGCNEEMLQGVFGPYGAITWCKVTPAKPGKKPSALVQFADPTDAAWFCENLNGNIPEGLTEPIQVMFSKNQGPAQGKGKGEAKGGGKDNGKGYGKVDAKGGKAAGWSPYDGGAKGDAKGGAKDSGKSGGKGGIKGLLKSATKGGFIPDNPKPDENCVYIKGLPNDTTDRDLYELFAPFGAIPPRGVLAQQKEGACTGVGFVDFVEQTATLHAIQVLNGMPTPDGDALFLKQKNPRGSGKGKGEGKDKGKDKGKGKGKW